MSYAADMGSDGRHSKIAYRFKFLEHSFHDWAHHSNGGRIRNPHGNEHRHSDETEIQSNQKRITIENPFSYFVISKSLVYVLSLTATNDRDHLESHTLMQIAMLNGQRNNETAYEHQHCVFHVHHACFVRFLMKLNEINCFVLILSLHSCTLTNIPSNGNSTIGSIDVIAVE